MVYPDPGLIEERLATVPRTFTIAARNRAKDLRFGGNDMVFSIRRRPGLCDGP
jgi:trimethylamine:corrinoid methyltransferase-like protein